MTLKEANLEIERTKQRRKNGEITLLNMVKHLDTIDRIIKKMKD